MGYAKNLVKSSGFDAAKIPDTIPGVMDEWKRLPTKNRDPKVCSVFYASKQAVTIHSDAVVVAAMLADPQCAEYREGSGVIRAQNNLYIGEYHHKSGFVTFCLYNSESGVLNASIMQGVLGGQVYNQSFPSIASKGATQANLIPILMPILASLMDASDKTTDAKLKAGFEEFRNNIQTIGDHIRNGTPGAQECTDALYQVSDCVYNVFRDDFIPCELKVDGAIPKVNLELVLNGAYSHGDVVCGNPEILLKMKYGGQNGSSSKKNSSTIKFWKEDARIKNYIAHRADNWSQEERQFIPQFDDNFTVPDEVSELALTIACTATSRRPVLNLAWRGTSGFGKSTGVEMLACILDIPLLRITCHSTMERENFLTEMMPNVNASQGKGNDISFDEIACDPEGVYERLTGNYVEGVTCNEVFDLVKQNLTAKTGSFVMKESAYIRALRYGYIIEIQEVSRIRDSGVLPGLNEYDRPGAMIPLVDGSYVRRHPNAIVFYTDNVGYNSCNELDPSVIRRIQYIIDSTELPKNVAIKRIMYNTGVADKHLVTSMYDVWSKVLAHCKDNDLTAAGGSVTIEELERWVQMVSISGTDKMQEMCQRCVISKATTDYDEQRNILTSVVIPALSKIKI